MSKRRNKITAYHKKITVSDYDEPFDDLQKS